LWIPLLCLLLIVGGGWIALAERQAPAAGGQNAEDRGQKTEDGSASPSVRRRPSSVLIDPNLVSPARGGLGNGELFLKMMLSVGLVLGLGGAALYLSKRVLPRMVQPGGKEIHLLETARLGPRQALHLVEVGGRRLLLASTSERVTMLTSLNEAWPEIPGAELPEAVQA
jgi:flagellar biogenesis protein FliO